MERQARQAQFHPAALANLEESIFLDKTGNRPYDYRGKMLGYGKQTAVQTLRGVSNVLRKTRASKDMSFVVRFALLAIIYIVVGFIAYRMANPTYSDSLVRPSLGVAIAVLLIYGPRLWPAALVGEFFTAHLVQHWPLAPALASAVFNTMALVLAVGVSRRFVFPGENISPIDVRKTVGFACVILGLGLMVGAPAAVIAAKSGSAQSLDLSPSLLVSRWLGGVMGTFVSGVFVLTWLGYPRPAITRPLVIEGGMMMSVVTIACLVIFGGWLPLDRSEPLSFILFPLAIWSVMRFGHHGATLTTGVVALTLIWGTNNGLGPFAGVDLSERLALSHAYVLCLAITSLLLASLREENRYAQRTASENEAHYRDLASSSFEGIIIHDGADIVEANHAFAALVGYSRDEIIGMACTDLIMPVSDCMEDLLSPQTDPKPIETLIRCKNGSTTPVEVMGKQTLFHHKPARVICVRDIGEKQRSDQALRASEKQYRDLVESSQNLVWATDAEGRLTFVNEAIREIIGLSPEQVVNNSFADFVAPEDLEHAFEIFRSIMNGETLRLIQLRCLRRDGSIVVLSVNAMPVRDDDGVVVGTKGTGYDITELHQAQKERRVLEAQMRHAQKLESLGVLAGGIAHDFNNLLTGVLGHAELGLEAASTDSTVRENLTRIRSAALKATDLTNQMLAYAGRGKLARAPVRLNEIVREMSKLLEVSLGKKTSICYEFDENLPPVDGDAAQLGQVVMNLITNANDAMEDRGGVITIQTGCLHVDKPYIATAYMSDTIREGSYQFIDVSDTGVGMSENTLTRIFEPFFTTKFAGRGLGLAATLGIVKGHNGFLVIASAQGKGSTFRVLFPATPHDDVFPIEKAIHVSRTQPIAKLVLVVDDEDFVLDVASRTLSRAGYRVLSARDGKEGIELYRQHAGEVAVVLLDFMMPEMDGVETFHELKRIRPDVCVILSSGFPEEDIVQRLAAQGLSGFIQKPYSSSALLEQIAEIVHETEPRSTIPVQSRTQVG